MNNSATIQTIIAAFALLFGYPYFDSVFVVAMAPFVLFMLVKQDARYLPALMLHCASDTTICFFVFFVIIFICLTKANVLFANIHTRLVLILLLLSFPIYAVLTYQKLMYGGFNWQQSLHYSCYYLSFWGFLYCYLIADTFDNHAVKLLLYSLLIVYLIKAIFPLGLGFSQVIFMIVPLGVLYGLHIFLQSKRLTGVFVCVLSLGVFFSNRSLTLSQFFSLFFSILLYGLLFLGKKRLAQKLTGWIPYLIIVFLMVYGINNYQTAQVGAYSDHTDFSSWLAFWNRVLFKFFDDRAVYWDAAWDQLMQIKPYFPVHNIPLITAYKTNGDIIEDVVFGAHNTPLQLFRIFGFLMGGALIFIYVYITTLSSKFFKSTNSAHFFTPVFLVGLSNVLVSFLTGTMTMLLDYALFGFGIMGIAYGLSVKNNQIDYDTKKSTFANAF